MPFALSLALASTNASGEVIFQDGFDFLAGALEYLVVWEDDPDGNGFNDLRARGDSASPVDQRINVDASGEQRSVKMAMADNGDFVVTWANDGDLNGFYDIFVRGFRADGTERFSTRKVNVDSSGQQQDPDIAMAPNGDFVIVWADDLDNNGFFQIRGRGYFANGSQKFADNQSLNDKGDGDQLNPVVGMADDGSFVVAWEDDQDNDKIFDISARRFSANGTPRFPQFYIRNDTAGLQEDPDIAVGPDGGFVVVWRDDRDMNFFGQILASGFDASGTTRFSNRTLNAVGTGNQYHPSVAIQDDGGFVATWVDRGERIMGRAYGADGVGRFGDVLVNADVFKSHMRPDIAVADGNRFLIVWQELNAQGNWRLRGRSILSGGTRQKSFFVDSGRGGDQQSPSVVIR